MPSKVLRRTTRQKAIAALAKRLEGDGNPRMAMLGVVLGASTAGFLMSAGLLTLGVSSMALRYSLAVCAGYCAFLLGIKIWLARRLKQTHQNRSPWLDHLDPSGLAPDSTSVEPSFSFGGGGGFSGSGAGSSLEASSLTPPPAEAEVPRLTLEMSSISTRLRQLSSFPSSSSVSCSSASLAPSPLCSARLRSLQKYCWTASSPRGLIATSGIYLPNTGWPVSCADPGSHLWPFLSVSRSVAMLCRRWCPGSDRSATSGGSCVPNKG